MAGFAKDFMLRMLRSEQGMKFVTTVMPQVAQRLEQSTKKMADMIIVGRAGAGMVEATFSGSGEMKQLAIDPALLKAGEDEVASIKVIQDLTVVAVNDARSKIAESDAQEFNEIVGGLASNMDGLFSMMGGGGGFGAPKKS